MTFSCINALLPARTRAMIAGALIGLSLASAVNAQSQSPLFDRAPVPEASTAPAPSSGPLDAIRNLWSGKKATVELLPPEQAFTLDVRFRDASTLVAELRPVQGYYLYRDRITFSMTEPATGVISDVALPAGKQKADPFFGSVQVYYQPVEAVIALRQPVAVGEQIQLRATYQGCNEPLGVCYPPIDQDVTVAWTGAAAPMATHVAPAAEAAVQQSLPAAGADDGDRIRDLFAGGNRWALLAAFFVLWAGAPAWLIGFSVIVAFASQLGDIAESAIKRRTGVKDSSNILPGHGGVLDRFDGLIGAVTLLVLWGFVLPLPGFGG